MEQCSNNTFEMDDTTSLTNFIEKLEWEKTILMDLDKQISAGISDDDLEAEILESEEMQSELSSTMARVKHLIQQFQVLTHCLHSSSPSQVSQTNRSSSPASSENDTLLTSPQSPVHEEGTYHELTKQNPSQRLTSDLDVSNTSHTKPHELRAYDLEVTVYCPS